MEDTGVTPGLGRLRGKSAVVTGAAKGIGRATAELFAREGALLVLTDVDEAGLGELRERLAGEDIEVETVVGDVSRPEDAKRMIGVAVEYFGRIDVLVANAGVIPLSTIVDATPEDWDHVMAVDGRGMFLTCKYAIEEMLKTGGGSGHHLDRGGRGAAERVQGADAGGPPDRAARGALRGSQRDPVPRLRRVLLCHRRDPACRRRLPCPVKVRGYRYPSCSEDVVAAIELGRAFAADDGGPPVYPQDRLGVACLLAPEGFLAPLLAPPLGEHVFEDALLRVGGRVQLPLRHAPDPGALPVRAIPHQYVSLLAGAGVQAGGEVGGPEPEEVEERHKGEQDEHCRPEGEADREVPPRI